MKYTEANIIELNAKELTEINGGLIFLLIVAATGLLNAGILAVPVAAAFYKGWNDFGK